MISVPRPTAIDACAQFRLGGTHLDQQRHGIERAIDLAQTPLDRLADFRMRQRTRVGRSRSVVALDHLCAFPPLVLQLE